MDSESYDFPSLTKNLEIMYLTLLVVITLLVVFLARQNVLKQRAVRN